MSSGLLRFLAALVALVAVASAATTPAFAQDDAPLADSGPADVARRAQAGRMSVKQVGGRLVVACDLATSVRRIPANLFVDFERPIGLELHNRAAGGQGLDVEGTTPPREVRILFPDFELTTVGRAHGDEKAFEDFTKYHSHEIGENAIVGAIGAHLLAQHLVTFDLAAGVIRIDPPRAIGAASPRAGGTSERDFDVPISLDNDMVWLPARLPGERTGVLALGTVRHDTLVDEFLCDELGAPAGDLEFLRIGSIDVAALLAPRPEPSTLVHPDGAIGLLGSGFLSSFRVEVDRTNRFMRIQRTKDQPFPTEDRAFFVARAADDADATEAFLVAHPEARLAEEAARLLVDQRLSAFAEGDELSRALDWFVKTKDEDLRCSAALDLVKELQAEGQVEAAVLLGEKGLASGRKDRYPESQPQVRSRLGQMLYEGGEQERAWRHLLAAAFGQPDDGMVNLYLGRIYEDQGKLTRAQSRYVQAVIRPESGPQALEGLDRVARALGESQGLSVETVDRMIAGKVFGFGAATKYEPDTGVLPNRRVLVEYFAGAHLDPRATLGGSLAFEGLDSHFDDAFAIVLTYHVPLPKLSPLCNDAARHAAVVRSVEGNIVFVVGGTAFARADGRQRDSEALYNGARRVVIEELAQFVDHEVTVEARIENGRIVGTARAEGPADPELALCVLLVENGVLFPGESTVVVHRNVVRANLVDSVNGVKWNTGADELTYAFDVALADLEAENRAFLDAAVAAGAESVPSVGVRMDARQLAVVAYVVDRSTGEVLQAARARAVNDEDEL
jgi:hypothetical protein